jgi:hypothetical protein
MLLLDSTLAARILLAWMVESLPMSRRRGHGREPAGVRAALLEGNVEDVPT